MLHTRCVYKCLIMHLNNYNYVHEYLIIMFFKFLLNYLQQDEEIARFVVNSHIHHHLSNTNEEEDTETFKIPNTTSSSGNTIVPCAIWR